MNSVLEDRAAAVIDRAPFKTLPLVLFDSENLRKAKSLDMPERLKKRRIWIMCNISPLEMEHKEFVKRVSDLIKKGENNIDVDRTLFITTLEFEKANVDGETRARLIDHIYFSHMRNRNSNLRHSGFSHFAWWFQGDDVDKVHNLLEFTIKNYHEDEPKIFSKILSDTDEFPREGVAYMFSYKLLSYDQIIANEQGNFNLLLAEQK